MGIFSKFEGRMEDTLEGAADKIAGSPLSPVQIAKKAEKQMRREKMVGAGKQYAPTLYTVLVSPADDERMFGYYPTLAGETETYLAAKAASNGLVMDGQPLVRFIVDDDLRRGKFDVIAEAVAAPLVAQLRAEEMERYGLGTAAPNMGYAQSAAPQQAYGASAAQSAYGAPQYDDYGANAYAAPQGGKEPLPYVPEHELDYSIDYGEYTFDSQDFDDYRNHGLSGVPLPNEAAAGVAAGAAAGAVAGAAAGAAANAAYAGAPETMVFGAQQPAQAAPAAAASAAAPQPALLDTAANRVHRLGAGRNTVGRESACDITLQDINASRLHAELRFDLQLNTWVISDLNSTNGTFVNGREIQSCPLREGDRITIGVTNLVFTRA